METVVVSCDGVAVQGPDGGLTYPRIGCHVTLAALPAVRDQLLALRLTRLGLQPRSTTVSLAAVEELEQVINDLCDAVERRLLAWDWLDADGEPLPSPPTRETLLSLTIEELAQLATMRPLPNPKGSLTSIAPSPGKKALRRQKRGT